jgi:hypothetical protein
VKADEETKGYKPGPRKESENEQEYQEKKSDKPKY